ncbi:hypothetical protein J6397_29445 [Rhodococcus qingshengii]|nr:MULTISPECIES: hypothetical protein [Rhodococcus]MBP1054282.1 hypothetical protein [Rhodococcus qingshengii]MDA3637758.1 hypothetical protein [Rhodococcus sp. C-2]
MPCLPAINVRLLYPACEIDLWADVAAVVEQRADVPGDELASPPQLTVVLVRIGERTGHSELLSDPAEARGLRRGHPLQALTGILRCSPIAGSVAGRSARKDRGHSASPEWRGDRGWSIQTLRTAFRASARLK